MPVPVSRGLWALFLQWLGMAEALWTVHRGLIMRRTAWATSPTRTGPTARRTPKPSRQMTSTLTRAHLAWRLSPFYRQIGHPTAQEERAHHYACILHGALFPGAFPLNRQCVAFVSPGLFFRPTVRVGRGRANKISPVTGTCLNSPAGEKFGDL